MEQEHTIPAERLAPVLDALGLEFLAGILEIEVARHPENLPALIELGHLYTRTRKFEKGLAVDRELVRRCPEDPTAHYNLACSLALLGESGAAIAELEKAVALGYDDADHLVQDEDLASLRGQEGFEKIVRALAPMPEPKPKPEAGPEPGPEHGPARDPARDLREDSG